MWRKTIKHAFSMFYISIPHEAAECGIENFEIIVNERVQVNPDNSRATSALTFLLYKLNTLHKETLH